MSKSQFFDAAESGDIPRLTSILASNSTVLNAKDERWYDGTALMLSSFKGHTEIARILVQHKASLDIQSKDGWTALIVAAYHGHLEIASLLMLNGADLELRDKEGKDARAWAEERGHTDIVTLIEKEDRWRRRRFWVMFSTAFRNAAATEPIGSPAMDMALSLEWVTRIVAGYL